MIEMEYECLDCGSDVLIEADGCSITLVCGCGRTLIDLLDLSGAPTAQDLLWLHKKNTQPLSTPIMTDDVQ